jgi:hypothetical protein
MHEAALKSAGVPELTILTLPADVTEVDRNVYLDFLTEREVVPAERRDPWWGDPEPPCLGPRHADGRTMSACTTCTSTRPLPDKT